VEGIHKHQRVQVAGRRKELRIPWENCKEMTSLGVLIISFRWEGRPVSQSVFSGGEKSSACKRSGAQKQV